MYEKLLERIKEYDNITVFRHQRPDGDSVFSAYALKEYIQHNFKDKNVRCLGEGIYDVYPLNDKVSDRFISSSLAIILDCSNAERVDDQRFYKAKEILLIDHHPKNSSTLNADLEIRDIKAAATCEILARIFFSRSFKDLEMTKKCAELLFCGLLTDSNSFSTASTTADTLIIGSRLIRIGDLKVSDLNDFVFAKDAKTFKQATQIRSKLKISNGVGYIILNDKDLKKIGMTPVEAKNCINDLSQIKELKIWAIFAYNSEYDAYDGSIRSRREYVINDICSNYNGGGHKNACGVKKLTLKKVKELVSILEGSLYS